MRPYQKFIVQSFRRFIVLKTFQSLWLYIGASRTRGVQCQHCHAYLNIYFPIWEKLRDWDHKQFGLKIKSTHKSKPHKISVMTPLPLLKIQPFDKYLLSTKSLPGPLLLVGLAQGPVTDVPFIPYLSHFGDFLGQCDVWSCSHLTNTKETADIWEWTDHKNLVIMIKSPNQPWEHLPPDFLLNK